MQNLLTTLVLGSLWFIFSSRRRTSLTSALTLFGFLIVTTAMVTSSEETVRALAPDGFRYVEQADGINLFQGSLLAQGDIGKSLFPLLVHLIHLGQPATLYGTALLSATLFLLIVVFLLEFADGTPRAIRTAQIALASPSLLAHALLPLRESLANLLLLLATLKLGCILEPNERSNRTRSASAWTGLLLCGLTLTRPLLAAGLLAAAASISAGRFVRNPSREVRRVAVGIAAIAIGISLTPLGSLLLEVSLDSISSNRVFNASISDSGFPDRPLASKQDLALVLPRDVARLLGEPNPLTIRGLTTAAGALDTVVLWLILLRLWRTRARLFLNASREVTSILAIRASIAIGLIYATTTGDMGQLLRGRSSVLLLLAVAVVARTSNSGLAFRPSFSPRQHGRSIESPART